MYYPYDEGKAGSLRDRHKSAEASEYLLAATEIIALAKEVLKPEEYSEAEDIAVKLTGPKRQKEFARDRLLEIVKPPPKRPLYYAQHEISYLPRWTRDALRDLGDFIDMLVKSAVYEKTNDRGVFQSSLGPAIDKFEKSWPNSGHLA